VKKSWEDADSDSDQEGLKDLLQIERMCNTRISHGYGNLITPMTQRCRTCSQFKTWKHILERFSWTEFKRLTYFTAYGNGFLKDGSI
jgi:hypothetical protein